jgi:hypothetical protein
MFAPKPSPTQQLSNTPLSESEAPVLQVSTQPTKHDAFVYLLDSDDGGWSTDNELEEDNGISVYSPTAGMSQSSGKLPAVPPLKRRKLEVPYCVQRQKDRAAQMEKLKSGLQDVDKLLKSAKTKFVGGVNGLQAHRTRAIRAHLDLVVRNGRVSADAAERAAEANGFAAAWGGRQLRNWTSRWINDRKLPESMRGRHTKVATLLSIPSIATELRAYLRSNKWSMNPEKLAKFTNNEMITKEADLYLKDVVNDEMPNALKRYIELELFPRIHLKVGRGISLSTARRWLHYEGFRYMSHKKGLYFDGHDRPDVVEYHQNVFLPAMKEFEHRLVRYTIGDVEKELFVPPRNYVERQNESKGFKTPQRRNQNPGQRSVFGVEKQVWCGSLSHRLLCANFPPPTKKVGFYFPLAKTLLLMSRTKA